MNRVELALKKRTHAIALDILDRLIAGVYEILPDLEQIKLILSRHEDEPIKKKVGRKRKKR
jgi:hypothetical protein